ncbi:unnamed protein product [Fraxinus pennsylvanica]|uniref:Uncharacterized protein n=1 Tax=Fraxinus pennsylvanica TaxID=56036 RepID=A0AAD2EAC5_9LAMI|nr:unnamed protein product [Fraxinus pennsylvanica]
MPSCGAIQSIFSNSGLGSVFLIKNLDAGKEFVVKESNEEGMWNNLQWRNSKSVGYSPLVKENRRRRGVVFLKGVANSMSGLILDKEREQLSPLEQRVNKKWVETRQHGKLYKEFTALHLSQEIRAQEGWVWTIKFGWDTHFLARACEDRIIRVLEVQECEVRQPNDLSSVSGTPYHPVGCSFSSRTSLAEITPLPSEKRKKGRIHKINGNSIY